jgi:hypothetical protein
MTSRSARYRQHIGMRNAQRPLAAARVDDLLEVSEGRARKSPLPLPWRFVNGPKNGGRSRPHGTYRIPGARKSSFMRTTNAINF